MSKVTINIQENVNPNFKAVWKTKKPYNILRGGRNSFKSSVIALQLIYMMLQYLVKGEKANVVVIRKVGNTIRDSVFLKIQWAIDKFGMAGQFKSTVAPFKITHLSTGSTFYFYGSDDFAKLKSNDIGNIIAVWYEEAAEFGSPEEFDQTNVTFMRQKHDLSDFVRFFWSYNPPRNPYHWINEWSDGMIGEDDYLVHHSSYKDDELGFVTEQMLADIERIKKNDFDYYRYIYLGEAVGLGNNVFNINLFKELKGLPEDDRVIGLYYSIDGGHAQSATTYGCFGLTAKGNVILLNLYYYSPAGRVNKKAPSHLAKDLNDFITKTSTQNLFKGARIMKRTIDSAEAALRNQYFADYGQHLVPVAKKKKVDMFDYVHSLLADGRFYYLKDPYPIGMPFTDSTEIFIEEHKKFSWDEKTLHTDNPRVIEEDDHSVDMFVYLCLSNARDFRLKV
ncbi:PBSX family phage terminase large subunit [Sporosarcina sp. ANT_H38]|uniref:PBSX family phage terminase large subunit n=1 Tax=Sporosarcina sp. ANT_H38 TaxID=2597358 RepID=UPI0011F346FF|nr:PBSX family phage terminase large subunit [Sporosarcina sp. ANT_H38]KAA0941609.1 PBSX family phage terminase large subunit [Sporosarcina sp. ANT_H38]